MENKTDKPYSLQDAKESISKINGFNDWSYLRSKYSKDGIETTMAEAAELYASKATEELETQISLFRTDREERMQLVEELRKENEELKNDLLDALDLKSGNGPTALTMLKAEIERLKESNKQMKEIFNMIKPQLVKHGFKGTTEEIEKFIQKSEGDLLNTRTNKTSQNVHH